MTQLVLRPGEQRRLVRGEDTVYAAQVQDIRGELVPGQAADLLDNAGNFVGRGLVGGSSKALLRLLTRSREDIDRAFFERRLRRAVEYRRRLGETECCRLVFGDADGLPGLTVDKFGPVLSLQTLTAGMDQRKELLCDLLEELLHPDAIYERNDVKVREKEGLAQQKGLLRGALPGELLVRENGFLLKVDVCLLYTSHQARPQKRPHPHHHGCRPPVRRPAGRLGAHRDHLLHPRHRHPDGHRHQAEKRPRCPGLGALHRRCLLLYQSGRRHPLQLCRPENPLPV